MTAVSVLERNSYCHFPRLFSLFIKRRERRDYS